MDVQKGYGGRRSPLHPCSPIFSIPAFPLQYSLPQRQSIHSSQFNTNEQMFMENRKKHMLSLHRTVDRIFLTQTQKLQLHLLMKHGCIYEVINKLLIDLSIYIGYFRIKDQDITS